jgi:integrase
MLKPVYRKAEVPAESHAWRDTLVFKMLRAGTSIEIIARLLAHANTAITWKHYAAWVPELQEQLEQAVRNIIHAV